MRTSQVLNNVFLQLGAEVTLTYYLMTSVYTQLHNPCIATDHWISAQMLFGLFWCFECVTLGVHQ